MEIRQDRTLSFLVALLVFPVMGVHFGLAQSASSPAASGSGSSQQSAPAGPTSMAGAATRWTAGATSFRPAGKGVGGPNVKFTGTGAGTSFIPGRESFGTRAQPGGVWRVRNVPTTADVHNDGTGGTGTNEPGGENGLSIPSFGNQMPQPGSASASPGATSPSSAGMGTYQRSGAGTAASPAPSRRGQTSISHGGSRTSAGGHASRRGAFSSDGSSGQSEGSRSSPGRLNSLDQSMLAGGQKTKNVGSGEGGTLSGGFGGHQTQGDSGVGSGPVRRNAHRYSGRLGQGGTRGSRAGAARGGRVP